ncbi:MAG TPA: HD domain-containing phosphohydrolase [Candidatus Polarisedimenticolaceae bacterium]|nr:HD domain-containing phosphohydrolase [Candidatus Polarisedimenticolaceae bacterium]
MTEAQRGAPPVRILVADDEMSIREVLADGLEAFGLSVVQAGNAAEAFAEVQAGGIDLVLSDIDMPGESGVALLARIKAHDPDIDVILVTGVVDVETAVSTIRQGAADYVTKPFNLEEVHIVVERTLEKRRLIRENREYQQRLESKVAERTRELVVKNQEVQTLYLELEASYESTLDALITALDFRDNETHGHSRRVVEYAVMVARAMGIVEPELSWIRRGAILHDVGKIGVPDAILRKPGKLDASEWEEMKRHPEMGYRMLKHIRFLEPALVIVYCHQERWDGSGYPRGLRGEEIPLGARIFAAVDTFDAMTSDRPYRAALSIEAAREEIRRYSGIQFDPRVAEAFLAIDEAVWRQIRDRVHREVGALGEGARSVG